MNTNETTQKITEAVQSCWPRERAVIAQLTFEGAYWHDEGTHMALLVWKQDNESEVVAATFPWLENGKLGELEASFEFEDLCLDSPTTGW